MRYLSYKEWKKLGYIVKKGERASKIDDDYKSTYLFSEEQVVLIDNKTNMIELKLTSKEWYFLHIQMERFVKENQHNYIPKDILCKLAENSPKLDNIKNELKFEMEYESIFVKGENSKQTMGL